MSYLIIGLGNPGKKYENTRHNIGRRVVEALAKKLGIEFREDKKAFGKIAQTKIKKSGIILLLPETFMNNSGKSAGLAAKYYKIKPANIFVVHDDSDIEFGKIKISFGKHSAGHKGVESVIKNLKTNELWRFRVGIRPPKEKRRMKAEKLVLQKFAPNEEKTLKKIIKETIEDIEIKIK
ncbi:MAG: aminoacyl-tRNA hydrolase [Parcubacteria group bacterium]|nr:aminoacyl-tRNA hydrolase [Parcubacteria group bacterium]